MRASTNYRSRQRKESRKKRRNMIIAVIVLFLILIGAAYGGVGYYFSTHFFPRTRISGRDVGRRTLQEAQSIMDSDLLSYRLTVHEENNLDEEITCEQAGLTYTNFEQIEGWLDEQEWYKWPIYYITDKSDTYDGLTFTADQEKVFARIDELACMHPETVVKSVSASIKYNDNKEAYEIVPESIGNQMMEKAFKKDVYAAISKRQKEITILDKKYYKKPKYMSDSKEITKAYEKLNGYLNADVTYEDRGHTAQLTNDDISKFLSWDKDFKVTLSREKINAFVEKTLFPVFNTVGKKRTFVSKGSGKITQDGGNYGWRVGVVLETDEIEKNLKKQEVVTRAPEYLIEGVGDDEKNDIGTTYIDVSIDRQHMWYVKDDKVVFESDIVTGNPSKGRDTPKGVWMIELKKRDHYMKENNVTVSYWMPIDTTRGIGFHDARWRGSFGGNIYEYNGSHGCINMPPAKAAELYEIVKVNTPAIVH